MSEINVTPMVDVMLVLLIIFMVSAPLLTVGVPIDLPQTQAKSLDQDKLSEYLRSHTMKTVVGDIEFGPNGEWKEARVLQVQAGSRHRDRELAAGEPDGKEAECPGGADLAEQAVEQVSASDLSTPAARGLFSAYRRLYEQGQPLELLRVMTEVEDAHLKGLLVELDENARAKESADFIRPEL